MTSGVWILEKRGKMPCFTQIKDKIWKQKISKEFDPKCDRELVRSFEVATFLLNKMNCGKTLMETHFLNKKGSGELCDVM